MYVGMCLHTCVYTGVCVSVYLCDYIYLCVCVCVLLCFASVCKGSQRHAAQVSWHTGAPFGKGSGWRKGPGKQLQKETGILWG